MRSPFLLPGLVRGFALFLSLFCLLNLLSDLLLPGFDGNLWWIDLRFLPSGVANSFLLVSALWLGAFGFRPPRSLWRRTVTGLFAGLLVLFLLANTIGFYSLLGHHRIHAGIPLPLSLLVCAGLARIFMCCFAPSRQAQERGLFPALAFAVACAILFPLLQMFCFGKTNYSRPADVAIVFGARVYADGRPSDALADRVRTAAGLYRQGLVGKLLMSGGPGGGLIDEPTAMKIMAVKLGVHSKDILLDHAGLNTQATVANSQPILSELHASKVIVVSHFYHLPRIKLAYARAGREVYTVPAKESYLLGQLPYNMAREVAALWVYYLRPLVA
jgi:vancomycin permeability regulator SanA